MLLRGPLLLPLLGLLAAVVFGGCANYQLGTTGKLTFSTLYVEPVKDSANIPQASALFSTQLRQTLLQDGRVQLVSSPQGADATLSVDLRNYDREFATARREDTGLARSFDINVVAVCSLRDNRTGKMLFERRSVEASREIFTSDAPTEHNAAGQPIFVSRQLQAEYQTLPLLAQSLADRVSHAVLDVW
jgi:hypothetical protein